MSKQVKYTTDLERFTLNFSNVNASHNTIGNEIIHTKICMTLKASMKIKNEKRKRKTHHTSKIMTPETISNEIRTID